MKIETKTEINLTKIYFDDILHIAFVRSKFIGMTTWKDYEKYSIELIMDGASIKTEYDSKELWVNIINELGKVLYP